MNNLIKLPIFLGITACLCGGVLALTNSFTSDKIAAGERERENAAYKKHFESLEYKKVIVNEDATTSKKGFYEKLYCFDASKAYIGTIYSGYISGFADKIKFTVSFKDGEYNNYINIASAETSTGAKFMDAIDQYDGNLMEDISSIADTTGSTYSFKAVNEALTICFNDYLGEYQTIGAYVEGEAK